jgi:hypothetical protein
MRRFAYPVVIAAAFFTRTVVVHVLPLTQRHTRTQRCPTPLVGLLGANKTEKCRTFLEHKNGVDAVILQSRTVELQSFRLLLLRCQGRAMPSAAAPPSLGPDSPPPVSPAAQLAAQPIADCAESVGLCQYFTVSTF